jgi:hypothetical protein
LDTIYLIVSCYRRFWFRCCGRFWFWAWWVDDGVLIRG